MTTGSVLPAGFSGVEVVSSGKFNVSWVRAFHYKNSLTTKAPLAYGSI